MQPRRLVVPRTSGDRDVENLPASPSKAVRRTRSHLATLPFLVCLLGCSATVFYFAHSITKAPFGTIHDSLQHQEVAPAPAPRELPSHRILLASHNRLAWYLPDTDELFVIHEGEVRRGSRPEVSYIVTSIKMGPSGLITPTLHQNLHMWPVTD